MRTSKRGKSFVFALIAAAACMSAVLPICPVQAEQADQQSDPVTDFIINKGYEQYADSLGVDFSKGSYLRTEINPDGTSALFFKVAIPGSSNHQEGLVYFRQTRLSDGSSQIVPEKLNGCGLLPVDQVFLSSADPALITVTETDALKEVTVYQVGNDADEGGLVQASCVIRYSLTAGQGTVTQGAVQTERTGSEIEEMIDSLMAAAKLPDWKSIAFADAAETQAAGYALDTPRAGLTLNRSSITVSLSDASCSIHGVYTPSSGSASPSGLTAWLSNHSRSTNQSVAQWDWTNCTITNTSGNTIEFDVPVALKGLGSAELTVTTPDQQEARMAVNVVPQTVIQYQYRSGSSDVENTALYSDGYFEKGASVYSPELSLFALNLSMSAFNCAPDADGSYEQGNANVADFLEQAGCLKDTIVSNAAYSQKPESNSIGVTVGIKPVVSNNKESTIIFAAVRGGNYQSEWAGNFYVGEDGQHAGFSTAKDQVIAFLQDYVAANIASQTIRGNVKVLITGYSRGAAVANLVAGEFTQQARDPNSALPIQPEDLYAYCFAVPQGNFTSDSSYAGTDTNIHNILSKQDLVTYVAPSAAGFCRYGQDYYLPSAESSSDYSELKAAMMTYYTQQKKASSYTLDSFRYQTLSNANPGSTLASGLRSYPMEQSFYLADSFSDFWNSSIQTRQNFVQAYQEPLMFLLSTLSGGGTSGGGAGSSKDFFTTLMGHLRNVVTVQSITNQDRMQLKQLVRQALSLTLTDMEMPALIANSTTLVDPILDMVVNLLMASPNDALTLLSNFSSIGNAHDPELCRAWLTLDVQMMQESSGTASTAGSGVNSALLNNGTFRVVRITGPADVKLVDQNGTVTDLITNNVCAKQSPVACGLNENNEKYVLLPPGQSCKLQILGAGNGLLSVNLDEYSPSRAVYTRSVDYNGIPLSTNDQWIFSAPAFSLEELKGDIPTGSSVGYALSKPSASARPGDSASSDVNIPLEGFRKDPDSGNTFFYVKGNLLEDQWFEYEQNWYYASSDGSLLKDMEFCDSKSMKNYYRFDKDGKMITGWYTDDQGHTYYYDNAGARKTRWLKKNNQWYHFSNEGILTKSQWITDQGNQYKLSDNGTMQASQWLQEDGFWMYVDHSGAKKRRAWLYFDQEWYYLDYQGHMRTGWQMIDGNWYYLYPQSTAGHPQGTLATNTTIDGYPVNQDGVWITG